MFHPQFKSPQLRKLISLTLSLVLYILMLPIVSSGPALSRVVAQSPANRGSIPEAIPIIPPGSAYRQTNLASDLPGVATIHDPLLVNPWGISLTASSPFWVANNGTSTSTLYRQTATTPFVKNPGFAGITIPGGLPTGTIANPSTTDFVLPGACGTPPCSARFIFASITGNITGWNPNAPAAGSTTAVIAASHPGRTYFGLAVGSNAGGNRLYAADFANGNIDVYDPTYALTTVSGGFVDPTIPTTAGNTYHPFNIQNIGGLLYVAYAKVGLGGHDEEGVGNGFVRRFNTDGVRDLTFGINNGPLNSPWGLTIAPASFGIFGGALLVGNFGEGNPSIHAFNPTTGAFLGTLQNEAGDGIEIDELWALTFGNGGNGGDVNTLYFSAGIAEEEHGLVGTLKPTTASATSLIQFSSDDYGIGEGDGSITITVTRNGSASGTATVNYATFDESQAGHASQKSDYEVATGTLTFGPGETSKTFKLLLIDDGYVEVTEVVDLVLSNPTGAGVGLGSPNSATLTITDNDLVAAAVNPLENAQFFVRQNYLDFLNREPDAGGLAYWTGQITVCGSNATCITNRRVNVSAAFFFESEFQQTGFFTYRVRKAAFGTRPSYADYVVDRSRIGGGSSAEKDAFTIQFLTLPEFVTKYSTLTDTQYVDTLLTNAGIASNTAFRDALIAGLGNATETRASVLRKVADNQEVILKEFNTAFVLAEYFGYLRREPDTAGLNFWLGVVGTQPPSAFTRAMVCAFLTSAEYQQRFAADRPRTDTECGTLSP